MRIAKKCGLASILNLALTSTALLVKYKFLGLNILEEMYTNASRISCTRTKSCDSNDVMDGCHERALNPILGGMKPVWE